MYANAIVHFTELTVWDVFYVIRLSGGFTQMCWMMGYGFLHTGNKVLKTVQNCLWGTVTGRNNLHVNHINGWFFVLLLVTKPMIY